MHEPVMVREILDGLALRSGGVYLDGTLGSGGHALALLERLQGDCRLLGIDRDAAAILASAAGQPIIMGHDAYGYFASHFGLSVAGAVQLGDATAE